MSNNVFLIGSRRAKVTDSSMARLLGADTRVSPRHTARRPIATCPLKLWQILQTTPLNWTSSLLLCAPNVDSFRKSAKSSGSVEIEAHAYLYTTAVVYARPLSKLLLIAFHDPPTVSKDNITFPDQLQLQMAVTKVCVSTA